MDERSYYAVLGIPCTASPGKVRAAYRNLAKQLHPDVAGVQATRAFQEITEAYDVLSDPARRRAYDEDLQRAEEGEDVAAAAQQRLDFEVLLTPEEAASGCDVPLDILESNQGVRVRLPRMVRPGSIYELSLPGYLVRLHVFVTATAPRWAEGW